MNKNEVIATLNAYIDAPAIYGAKRCWLERTEQPNEFYEGGGECDGTLYVINEDHVLARWSNEYGAQNDDVLPFDTFLNDVIRP